MCVCAFAPHFFFSSYCYLPKPCIEDDIVVQIGTRSFELGYYRRVTTTRSTLGVLSFPTFSLFFFLHFLFVSFSSFSFFFFFCYFVLCLWLSSLSYCYRRRVIIATFCFINTRIVFIAYPFASLSLSLRLWGLSLLPDRTGVWPITSCSCSCGRRRRRRL